MTRITALCRRYDVTCDDIMAAVRRLYKDGDITLVQYADCLRRYKEVKQ